jgi:hypothetical protein
VPAPGGTPDETADVAIAGDADVPVTPVRNVPENPGPYEDPVGTVTPPESEGLILDGFTFQRAGQKGLVVAGDATNNGDRGFQNVVVEVTRHDRNETADGLSFPISCFTHGRGSRRARTTQNSARSSPRRCPQSW